MNIQVGQQAPGFTLKSHLGTEITLGEFKGHRNILIAFFPLAWTPV
jgi:peroxiredoxin